MDLLQTYPFKDQQGNEHRFVMFCCYTNLPMAFQSWNFTDQIFCWSGKFEEKQIQDVNHHTSRVRNCEIQLAGPSCRLLRLTTKMIFHACRNCGSSEAIYEKISKGDLSGQQKNQRKKHLFSEFTNTSTSQNNNKKTKKTARISTLVNMQFSPGFHPKYVHLKDAFFSLLLHVGRKNSRERWFLVESTRFFTSFTPKTSVFFSKS